MWSRIYRPPGRCLQEFKSDRLLGNVLKIEHSFKCSAKWIQVQSEIRHQQQQQQKNQLINVTCIVCVCRCVCVCVSEVVAE